MEYEILHLLCFSFGRFWHHVKVRGEKKEFVMVEERVKELVIKGDVRHNDKHFISNIGHWSVMHKIKNTR